MAKTCVSIRVQHGFGAKDDPEGIQKLSGGGMSEKGGALLGHFGGILSIVPVFEIWCRFRVPQRGLARVLGGGRADFASELRKGVGPSTFC